MPSDTPPRRSVRAWFHQQLATTAWHKPGLSPVNTVLVVLIILSIATVILETEPTLLDHFGEQYFMLAEVVLGTIFIAEYLLRVWSAAENPKFHDRFGRLRYMTTFCAVMDLLAIIPTVLLVIFGINVGWVRTLRLVRVLRLARFGAISTAFTALIEAVERRRYELVVSFLLAIVLMLTAATCMWLVERDAQPEAFGSIPRAIWWSIVTMTTVGYGDVTPVTTIGKMLASMVAFLGIGLVAIPTGIMAASFADTIHDRRRHR